MLMSIVILVVIVISVDTIVDKLDKIILMLNDKQKLEPQEPEGRVDYDPIRDA